jgi:hypothetical protein
MGPKKAQRDKYLVGSHLVSPGINEIHVIANLGVNSNHQSKRFIDPGFAKANHNVHFVIEVATGAGVIAVNDALRIHLESDEDLSEAGYEIEKFRFYLVSQALVPINQKPNCGQLNLCRLPPEGFIVPQQPEDGDEMMLIAFLCNDTDKVRHGSSFDKSKKLTITVTVSISFFVSISITVTVSIMTAATITISITTAATIRCSAPL